MQKRNFLNGFEEITGNFMTILVAAATGLFLLVGIINCSGGKQVDLQATTDIIQKYVAKHETMVDQSLVDLYVKEEQASVAKQISATIAAKGAAGTLDKLQHATFDFAGLAIEVVDEKEEYVDDQPQTFIKVKVTGSYIMKLEDDSRQITANNVVILERQKNTWKVTENFNPWS